MNREWEDSLLFIDNVNTISRVIDGEHKGCFWVNLKGNEDVIVESKDIENIFEIKGSDHE